MITRIVERGRTLFVTFDILVFTSLIWFMVQFLRFVFPPLFETIQGDYGVSNTEVGLMFSALLFAYSCMQFPAGYLSDVFNERVVITAGTVVFGLGSLLVVLSDPFWTLLVGVGLIGLGTGTHKTVAVNLLSRLYPSKTGLSIGVMDTIGQAGGVFAPAVVVLVFAIAIDWRAIFLVGAVVCVALAYGFHRSLLRTVSEADTAERRRRRHCRRGRTCRVVHRHLPSLPLRRIRRRFVDLHVFVGRCDLVLSPLSEQRGLVFGGNRRPLNTASSSP